MSNYSPILLKPSRFAVKVKRLLAKKLQEKWSDFNPENLHYSLSVRCDAQICGYKSMLYYVYFTDIHQPRWITISIGCVEYQRELTGELILVNESDAANYSVWKK